VKTVWTDGLEPDVIREIKGDFVSSKLVRKRLKKLIDDKIETKRASVRKDSGYDKPNWENYVADALGYERALYEIISLIDEN
jgi:hypothetical protein